MSEIYRSVGYKFLKVSGNLNFLRLLKVNSYNFTFFFQLSKRKIVMNKTCSKPGLIAKTF